MHVISTVARVVVAGVPVIDTRSSEPALTEVVPPVSVVSRTDLAEESANPLEIVDHDGDPVV